MKTLRLLCVALLAALLGACGTYGPGTLNIDRSIEAQGQNSRVSVVVLHYTSTGNEASLKTLSKLDVSSHYLITNDVHPKVYQLVDESRRAWHAGLSQWHGNKDLNSRSIGIEIVNHGNENGQWEAYTPAQLDTLTRLLRDIVARHQIKPHNIVGHSDIAPQRKIDPGPLFPWRQLAERGLGRWYDRARALRYQQAFAATGVPDMLWVQRRLQEAGYDVPANGTLDHATKNVIAAFQMRYRPRLYDGQPDTETLAILQALLPEQSGKQQ